MKIGLKTMLLDVTCYISYFAAVAKYNLARKYFRAARKFCSGNYVI